MTSLPAALAPWATELSAFPVEVGLALGPMVSRLALALGPMSKDAASRVGEPDGFDGVTRRGSYAHLVSSEWALADALPDEFLRRASAGELSFLRVRRQEGAAGRASLALFDAGPSQIGTPRIAQLATLVVLSQRARASRVGFRWGIVQRPKEGWVEGLTPATARRLLAGRTAAVPRPDDLRLWASDLGREATVGEVWLVGGAGLGGLAPEMRAALVAIDDPLEPDSRTVAVRCGRFRRPEVSLILELPQERMCARLLRDPFTVATATPLSSMLGPSPKLTLSFGGRKLIVKHDTGKLSLFTVPNSPRQPASRTVSFTPSGDETPIASDCQKGRWRIVTQHPAGFVLHTIAKGGGPVRPPAVMGFAREELPPPDPGDGIATLVRSWDGVECFVHPSQTGVELRGTRIATVGRVKAVGLLGRGVLWVRERDNASWMEGPGYHPEFAPSKPGRAFFGWPGKSEDGWLLALPTLSNLWKIHTEKTSVSLSPPTGTHVVGIVQGPALLLRDGDERSPVLLGIHRHSRFPPLADPVSEACACPSGPYVAYSSRAGELIVYSLERNATVLHVLPNGEHPS